MTIDHSCGLLNANNFWSPIFRRFWEIRCGSDLTLSSSFFHNLESEGRFRLRYGVSHVCSVSKSRVTRPLTTALRSRQGRRWEMSERELRKLCRHCFVPKIEQELMDKQKFCRFSILLWSFASRLIYNIRLWSWFRRSSKCMIQRWMVPFISSWHLYLFCQCIRSVYSTSHFLSKTLGDLVEMSAVKQNQYSSLHCIIFLGYTRT